MSAVRAMLRVGAALAMACACANAQAARLLVPAYANPCCGDGPAMWAGLIALGTTSPDELGVVFNPASGPGTQVDPNYLDDSGQGVLADLLATGAPVYGYVATSYAGKPLATASAEIEKYYSSVYWRGHPQHLSGIFFDEMSNDLADVAYYQALRDAVRQLDAAAYIIGNPGVSETINPSAQVIYADADYAAVFDALVVFEDVESGFATGYAPPPWSAGATQLGMIVHTAPTGAEMRAAMSRALGRAAAWLFITDDVEPNPYDRLPAYWSDEAALLPALIFVDSFE